MFVFGKRAHLVLATQKTQTFEATAEEEFPSVAWLVRNGGARTDPSPLWSAGHSQGTQCQHVLLRGGRMLARSEKGCTEGSLSQQPLPQQRLGEGAGLAWLGERQFCFLFSGQGGIAVQAALLRLGQRKKEKLHS